MIIVITNINNDNNGQDFIVLKIQHLLSKEYTRRSAVLYKSLDSN